MCIIESIKNLFSSGYWIYVSIVISIYWGLRGVFYGDKYIYKIEEDPSKPFSIVRDGDNVVVSKSHHFFVNRVYEFVFHFIGSMSGWICLMLLVNIRSNFYETSKGLILFVFALLGITGHLPQALYGFVRSIGILSEKFVNKISK